MEDVFGDGTMYETALSKPRRKWYAWHDATWMLVILAVFIGTLLVMTWR